MSLAHPRCSASPGLLRTCWRKIDLQVPWPMSKNWRCHRRVERRSGRWRRGMRWSAPRTRRRGGPGSDNSLSRNSEAREKENAKRWANQHRTDRQNTRKRNKTSGVNQSGDLPVQSRTKSGPLNNCPLNRAFLPFGQTGKRHRAQRTRVTGRFA